METYIPIEECKDGFLYEIDSRNLSYGVYRATTQGFSGIRSKFGSRYIFEEDHWDTGAPHGTVKPIKEICECLVPVSEEQNLFDWLDKKLKELFNVVCEKDYE